MILSTPKKTSVHLGEKQVGLFMQGSQITELKQKTPFTALDSKWVRKIPRIVLGRESTVFIHLDLRLPFGEEVTHDLVEQELREKLGARRNDFGMTHWLAYFNEDTQQGTLYRLLVTFEPTDAYEKEQPLSDVCFPIEYGVLTLGAKLHEELGKGEFQFIFRYKDLIYSLIYTKNGPYHLLKLDVNDSMDFNARLNQQGNWSKSKNSLERVTVQRGLESLLNIDESFRFVELKFLSTSKNSDPMLPAMVQAALSADFQTQNETTPESLAKVKNIRQGKVFLQSVLVTLLVLLGAGGGVYGKLALAKNRLLNLEVQEKAHTKVLQEIESLKNKENKLSSESDYLRPLWFQSFPVQHAIDDIRQAMPENSGLFGLRLEKSGVHEFKLTFKAWVKNWDHVSSFKRNLGEIPFISETNITDQKRNLKKDIIIFQVASTIKE